ncbi:transposase [Aquabacterium commune]|uniref:Transposase n=1 Tax=Aquabacterium commune TaxID=70586 RepID=A0A4R6R1N5_9BURK|nr:transposase [Aquabacterium commune]
MAGSYRPYEPDQVLLLPAAPQDWLPAGHLAYFIHDTVDALDLKAFYARYEGGGSRNQPFHPAMMVKVLVYAYATGVFSSRKIERRLHEDLAFRMLAAGNFPRHRTICDFRAFHLKELSELFVQVVKLAREMGLVKLGTVAIDGTKVKANASRHKAMSYERMKQAEVELKAQIDALLARAKATDDAEASEPELDLLAEIERRETRLAAIRQARERLEQRQREADLERGRSEDDDRRPRGPDGQPRGGRYKREFGVPEDKAQENFTDRSTLQPCAASSAAQTPRPPTRTAKFTGGLYRALRVANASVGWPCYLPFRRRVRFTYLRRASPPFVELRRNRHTATAAIATPTSQIRINWLNSSLEIQRPSIHIQRLVQMGKSCRHVYGRCQGVDAGVAG